MNNRLKEIREKKGLTQSQLAEKSGVDQASISLLENGGKNPSWAKVSLLSEALRVKPEELFPVEVA